MRRALARPLALIAAAKESKPPPHTHPAALPRRPTQIRTKMWAACNDSSINPGLFNVTGALNLKWAVKLAIA